MQYDKLKSDKSFAQLRRSGSSFVAPAFVILAKQTNNDETLKIGFTASKKVGNAIKRALARRRLRAAINEMPTDLIEYFKGYEFNIVARHKVLTVEFEKLTFYFKKTLENIQKQIKNEKKD